MELKELKRMAAEIDKQLATAPRRAQPLLLTLRASLARQIREHTPRPTPADWWGTSTRAAARKRTATERPLNNVAIYLSEKTITATDAQLDAALRAAAAEQLPAQIQAALKREIIRRDGPQQGARRILAATTGTTAAATDRRET
jgi:hypothetical protein